MRYGVWVASLIMLAIAACSSADDGNGRARNGAKEGPDASGIEDAPVDDHPVDATGPDASSDSPDAGAVSPDASSVNPDAGTPLQCPGTSSDAAQCIPEAVLPLVATQDAYGNCTATLPSNIDTSRLSIEVSLASSSGRFTLLKRLDAPCADQAGWYLVNDSNIEICGLCSGQFDLDFWAVVGCTDWPDGAAADACVPEIVTVPVHLEEAGCFMDLLPDADWCVPLSITVPFGIGGGGTVRIEVPYMPKPSCDDPANTGWQPVNQSTLRLCAGACVQPPVFDGSPFQVTLKCGDAGG